MSNDTQRYTRLREAERRGLNVHTTASGHKVAIAPDKLIESGQRVMEAERRKAAMERRLAARDINAEMNRKAARIACNGGASVMPEAVGVLVLAVCVVGTVAAWVYMLLEALL